MTQASREELELVAGMAARAGAFLLENFGRVRRVDRKGAVDLVTDVDHRSEERLLEDLGRHFPGDSVEAEEGRGRRGEHPVADAAAQLVPGQPRGGGGEGLRDVGD